MPIIRGGENTLVKQNDVADDKKQLLQTGAIIITTNSPWGWTPQTLAVDSAQLNPADVLRQTWDVEDREDAEDTVERLLAGPTRRGDDDARLARYTRSEVSALSPDESCMVDEVAELLTGCTFGTAKLTKDQIDSVITTVAWDIERAAFVARLAYNSGYLCQDEVWDMLERTRSLAQSHFETWRDYGISFIKGRAIVMCHSTFADMADVWASTCLLAEPERGVWAWEPLRS